jgi:hypothetical protein
MSNFSTNQIHQLYVISGYNASVTDASAVGTIGAIKSIDDIRGKEVMFNYKGAESVLASDFIQIHNIGYAKAVPASDMVTVMKKVEVTLDSTINSGAPVSGQDYVLSINFKNFFSSGDASQYFKDAAVHATANMTASDFYKAMLKSLNAAFSREPGATKESNPYLKFSVDDTTTATKLIIEEKPQEWALGTKKARRIMFDVVPTTIYTGGDDVVWGTVTDATPAKASAEVGTNAIGNGQQIADLEWFCMGERGDQYRNVGWPHVIPTKYLVDPTQQYHVLELHYAFTDTGVNSYRTEKEITIVAPATTDGKKALNDFIDALENATDLTIAGID